MIVDRSGSILIQEVIRSGGEVRELTFGRAELILTGCWYIWWQRRQRAHGEDIQNYPRSALSIAAITTNYSVASDKGAVINQAWKKPSERCPTINVDTPTMKQRDRESLVTPRVALLLHHTASYHIQLMRPQQKHMR